MTLTIDDEVLHSARLTAEQLRLELAVALFQGDRLTLAQAAGLAEVDRLTFQHVLAGRGVSLHYTAADWEKDLSTLGSSSAS